MSDFRPAVVVSAALGLVVAAGVFALSRDPAPIDKPYAECRASLPASGRDCEQERDDLDRSLDRVMRGIELLDECIDKHRKLGERISHGDLMDANMPAIEKCADERAEAEGLTDEDLGKSEGDDNNKRSENLMSIFIGSHEAWVKSLRAPRGEHPLHPLPREERYCTFFDGVKNGHQWGGQEGQVTDRQRSGPTFMTIREEYGGGMPESAFTYTFAGKEYPSGEAMLDAYESEDGDRLVEAHIEHIIARSLAN